MAEGLERILKGLRRGIITAGLATSLFIGCSEENPVETKENTSVSKQNSPPVFTSNPIKIIDENKNYNYQIQAKDADGDKLTYSLVKNPPWLSISNSGLISGSAPEVSSDEIHEIEVRVSDEKNPASQKYNLTVKNLFNTYVLDNNQTAKLLNVDNTSLSFSQPMNFSVGDIVASEISIPAPDGFLRKVNSISSDKKIVYTEQTTLEEAVKDGSFAFQGAISPVATSLNFCRKGVSISKTASPFDFNVALNSVVIYDFDDNPATTEDRLIVDGNLSFNLNYELKGKINNHSLDELMFKLITTEKCDLKLKSSASFGGFIADIPLGEYSLPAFILGYIPTVPPIPIIVKPKIDVNLEFFGGIAPVETSISQQTVFTAELDYKNGQWQPKIDCSNSFAFVPPNLEISKFSCYIKAGPTVKFPLYNVAGPTGKISGKLNLETFDKKWSLSGGLEGKIGIEMKIFKHILANFNAPLFNYTKILAEGAFIQPDTITIQPGPEGKDAYVRKYNYPDGSHSSFGDGNEAVLEISNVSALTSSVYESLLEFSLSSIPKNTKISSAKLMLYGQGAFSDETASIDVYRILDQWDESNIEWDTKPAYSSSAVTNSVLSSEKKWYEWDITYLIKEWMNGNAANYGLSLLTDASRPRGEPNAFKSSDYLENVLYRPKIVITYY